MKVYIVLEHVKYEGSTVIEVHKSKIKAYWSCIQLNAGNDISSISFDVESWEVK